MSAHRDHVGRDSRKARPRATVAVAPVLASLLSLLATPASRAQGSDVDTAPLRAARPSIRSNRWQEDWSALADPARRTHRGDALKYIALSADSAQTYLSLGLNLRERFESNRAPRLGVDAEGDSYLLQRLQVHADLRIRDHWQLFTQIENARTAGKRSITPVDRNPADLRLAFVAYSRSFGTGTLKTRVGRQDFAFDLQRFVSLRDGPNVRQSFDAVWADWETGTWRFIGFLSQPVQYAADHPFDDSSSPRFRFDTLRVERLVWGHDELSAYYARYARDGARYLDAAGREQRWVTDVRFAGSGRGFDWDLEAMWQRGSVGGTHIQAWAVGTRAGYTFEQRAMAPRLGLQFDAASGDAHPDDHRLGTFNPLFPNGYYYTLAGYTGDANLLHLKPSVTLKPTSALTATGAVGLQWRQTTSDAVYLQPDVPLTGTAGRGGRWSGAYAQLRTDYAFNANLTGAIEAVHYAVGRSLREAGAHDSNYLGAELKLMW